MDLTAGGTLGPYQLLGRIGAGGMAEVWRAVQPSLDRVVAIKVLPRHLAAQPGYLDRFRREARAISRLDHPNILGIHDFGEDDGYTYMVMPFLSGGTLARNLGRPWSVRAAVRVLTPLASALDYAHQRGVVHRDVKPSNVLIAEDGRVVLGDFGIARVTESMSAASLTGTGSLVGTPEYMSPEQVQGIPASPASDQYALGVIAYEMLTGRRPFEAETPIAVAMAHVHRPLPPPSTINPAIPTAVEIALSMALAKRPEDRYPSASAFVAALAAAEPGAGGGPAGVGPADGSRPTIVMPVDDQGGTDQQHRTAPPFPPPSPSPGPSPTPPSGSAPTWSRSAMAAVVGIAVAVISVLTGLYVAWSAPLDWMWGGPGATPTATPRPPTTTPMPVTATPRPPTSTPAPPTATSRPPTNTPVPPTATPRPPTNTPVPPTATRVSLTATPVLPNQVFREDFERGSGQFPSRTTADYAQIGYNGQYVLKTTNPKYPYALTALLPSATTSHTNGALIVDAHLVGDTSSRYIMLTCRGQPNTGQGSSHYRAVIEPSRGRFIVELWVNGQSRALAPWAEHAAIARGNAPNHLELRCVGQTISFGVNGQTVAIAQDGTHRQGAWGIGTGVFAEQEADVEAWFDNVVLRVP